MLRMRCMHKLKKASEIKDEEELMEISGWLRGKKLKAITEEIAQSDGESRVKTKGNVGYVIEEGFFGIKKNSVADSDIEHLGIEIKTCPLKHDKSGRNLQVKEPLSLGIINYNEESKHTSITDSKLYKKNKKILIICYIQDIGVERSEYPIKYVFIWNMNNEVLKELEPDYQKIVSNILQGRAHEIHQTQHDNLTICPKHSGKYKDEKCSKSKTTQPFSKVKPEVRAFRLKSSYMAKVITRHLGKKLQKKGRSLFWSED
jgi:DNA mismatch repair protein MutH